ncbi:MAG: hypothetical protein AAF517_28100, partial [Planctomycetota bacterium]
MTKPVERSKPNVSIHPICSVGTEEHDANSYELGRGDLVPKGRYLATIVDAAILAARYGVGEFLELRFEILEEDWGGVVVSAQPSAWKKIKVDEAIRNTTDERGRCELRGFDESPYLFDLWKRGYEYVRRDKIQVARDYSVDPGRQLKTIQFWMNRLSEDKHFGKIRVRLFDIHSKPVANREVWIRDQGPKQAVVTDEDGFCELETYEGEHFVDSFVVNELGRRAMVSERIPVDPERVTEVALGLPPQQGRCRIRVVDMDGQPISKVKVTLRGPRFYQAGTTGDGLARFDALAFGEYAINLKLHGRLGRW